MVVWPESLFDWNFDELSENPDQSAVPFHLRIYEGCFSWWWFLGDLFFVHDSSPNFSTKFRTPDKKDAEQKLPTWTTTPLWTTGKPSIWKALDGTVRFVGSTDFAKGLWLGVELEMKVWWFHLGSGEKTDDVMIWWSVSLVSFLLAKQKGGEIVVRLFGELCVCVRKNK